jgi:CubicO group peptidase (beta-lactamase class C family)
MSKDYSSSIKLTGKIIDAWLPWKVKYSRIPGVAVGITYRGKLVYDRGFGYADIEKKVKMSPRNCFRIASISKNFTAFAVMSLVEEGKIKLGDKVGKYLPWFSKQASKSAGVTIRQLLTHSSGVFRDGEAPHWENDVFPDRAAFKKMVNARTTVMKTPAKFKYSNFGYSLLGEVVRTASGLSYDEYVMRRIIKPLGLKSTWPDLTPAAAKKLSRGYSRIIPGEKRKAFAYFPVKAFAPATGFISNVPDLAKYLAAWSIRSGKLASRATKKTMFESHVPINDKGSAYGFGFRTAPLGKRKLIGHGGGFAGFMTALWFDPASEIGVIVLINGNSANSYALCRGIFETIYRLHDETRLIAGKRITGGARYDGTYRARWFDAIIVNLGSSLAVFDPSEESPLKNADLLFPLGGNRFRMETVSNFEPFGEVSTFYFKGKNRKAAIYDSANAHPAKRIA